MPHTGYQDLRPEPYKPKLPTMLAALDRWADTLDLRPDWPELAHARQFQQRADELRTELRQHANTGREQVIAAGRRYAAGRLGAAALIEQACTAATLTGDGGRVVAQMVEAAAAAVEAEGAPLLHNITEARWLKLLRPKVAGALKHANAIADEIGVHQPKRARVGVRSTQHPWAPAHNDLSDMGLRHKWERLEPALLALDELHQVADTLRTWQLLPLVDGRTVAEDYRWLRTDRLQGRLDPAEARQWFLANRAEGEPGLFTAEQMSKAGQPEPAPAA